MAVSKLNFKLLKALYWLIVIPAHLYMCYLLLSADRAVAGVLWLIIGGLILYMMYFVFFPAGSDDYKWPPYISSCPDYLTLVAPNACMDFVGLYNGSLPKKSDPTNPIPPTDPRYQEYVFNPQGSMAQRAQRAQQSGLTWEGVTH